MFDHDFMEHRVVQTNLYARTREDHCGGCMDGPDCTRVSIIFRDHAFDGELINCLISIGMYGKVMGG